jgi:RNA polymerase sigma-70 factor (ECF subfamily)
VDNSTETVERELVLRAQGGDRSAFNDLVTLHASGVIKVIYRMCSDTQLAEDAAQETFLRAWSHLNTFRPEMSLRNWLYRIGLNVATDMLRKENHIDPADLEDFHLPDPQLGPEGAYLQDERIALVQAAVASLPEASRVVLVLKEYGELSYREIAESLYIPLGTVMSRLNYARRALKEKLEGEMVLSTEVEHV